MITNIREIFNIKTQEELSSLFNEFDEKIEERIKPLVEALNKNLLSTDVSSLAQHASFVESWRERVNKLHAFTVACTEYSKSSVFLPAKDKNISELDRDSVRRKISAGWVAWTSRLEGLLICVDSRSNMTKKMLGMEDGSYNKQRSYK